MACQISYERLNKLFFDSIAFDPKYKSYREMANRIFSMALTEESKVTSVWYMGLLYNNAIPMDNQIRTEDLPRTVAALVADKIGNESADFIDLYKKVKDAFAPQAADEADLSGGVSTDAKANIERRRQEEYAKIDASYAKMIEEGEKRKKENIERTGLAGDTRSLDALKQMVYNAKRKVDILLDKELDELDTIDDKKEDIKNALSYILTGKYSGETNRKRQSVEVGEKIAEKIAIDLSNRGLIKQNGDVFSNLDGKNLGVAWSVGKYFAKEFKEGFDAELAALEGKPTETETDNKVTLSKKFADTYNIIYNGKTIGTIDIPSDLEGDTISIGDVNIKSEFRGKGLGVETYKAAIKIAKKPLESFMATPEATRVWNSLIKQGLAKKTDTGFITISPTTEVIEEKPLTLKDIINEEFKKITKVDAAEFDQVFDKIYNLTKDNPELSVEEQLKVFDKLKKAINTGVSNGSISEVYRARITSIIDEYRKENTIGVIDYGEVEGIGKNMYVIRQADGTVFQAYFDEETGKYYRVSLVGEDRLEEYIVRDSDYITPNYYRPRSRTVSTDKGKSIISRGLAINGISFSSEGVGLNARVMATDKRGYQPSNMELLRNNLKSGSVVDQIVIIADRRRVRLNAARAKKFGLEWEHNLRPDQIKALQNNPDVPAVAFLHQKTGVQLTIQNKNTLGEYAPGDLFSYITSLDNLGFVYANGNVRPVDWNSPADLELLTKTLKVRRSSKDELRDATPADIQVYKTAVENIKKLKDDIVDIIDEDETYELTSEEVRKYFSIINAPFNWTNVDFKDQNENDTVPLIDVKDELAKFGSTITANVGKRMAGGEITNITTEEVVGIVKVVDGRLEFQSSLEEGRVVLDENNKPLKGGIRTLFLNQGLDEAKIIEQINRSRKTFAYLTMTSSYGWTSRPLIGTSYINTELDKVSFIASLSALVENLPSFNEDNAPMFAAVLNSFAENGWGFNMYAGLIANLDYRKSVSGKKDVFYVNVRPDRDYEYAAGLGDKKVIGRFELDFDYKNSILNLKKIASTLKLDYNPKGTTEEKINFGKELQKKLNDAISDPSDLERIIKNPSKSNAFELAISELINEYNAATANLHEQIMKAVDKHNKHVEKGGEPYLNTEKNTLEYLLFNKKGDPSTFKIRDNSVKSNPLQRFRTFDKKIGGSNDSILSINFSSANTINYKVTKSVPVTKEEPTLTKKDVGSQIFNQNRRERKQKENFKLVNDLKGLKVLNDEEWNSQIDEARRILGTVIEITNSDLSGLDVGGTALGYYENKVITLNNALKVKGIVFHEAFHGVFRVALTNEKRAEVLKNALILYGPVKQDFIGSYLEHNGKKVYFDEFRQKRRYMGLSEEFTRDLILEEFLADGFMDYKLNKIEPQNALIRAVYRAIDALMKLFSSPKYKAAKAIQGFYTEIDNGQYANVIGDEITSYPRAYELADVPSYITLNPATSKPVVNKTTVSVEVHEQLKNRVLHEMFVRSGNIKTKLDFNAVYDAVTKDLIQEYNIERYIDKNNEMFRNQILEKYGTQFRAMRYILGSLHREDIRETFVLKNLTGKDEYDTKDNTESADDEEATDDSIATFENFREEVYKDFSAIEVGTADTTTQEDEEELAKGDIDEEGGENIQSSDESEVGENFRDDGILTFNPYNGDRNFQKLLRFVKYTYTDALLNVTYTKMVNSRTIINTIRKVVLNKPFNQKLKAIQDHIDILERNIDELYDDENLISLLNNKLPNNAIKMEDTHDQLVAVMDFIKDMAGLDENYNITIESGRPFVNMFHHVFNYSSVELDAIKAVTKSEVIAGDESEEIETAYGTNYEKVEMLQKSEIGRAKDEFETDVVLSLTALANDRDALAELREAYNIKYETPTSEEGLRAMTNELYKIFTMAQLEIPRYVIEYSVAADMEKTYELDDETKEVVNSILDADKSLFNEGSYIKLDSFFTRLKSLYNSNANTFEKEAIDKKVTELVNAYTPAIPLQLLYDAASYSVVVRNLDGKPISKIVPNVPSIEILNQIKNKGLLETIERIYGKDQVAFFMDNPFFKPIMEGWNFDKNATSEEGLLNNRLFMFLEGLKISVSGGLTQEIEYNKRSTKGTFKALGDKSYMLSLLGLFANRKRRSMQKGKNVLITFTRPITQLEATSTQFNIQGLYESYHTGNKLNTKLIVDKFKSALNQEFNRIKREWSQRYDDKPRREGWNAKTIISEEVGGVSTISTTDTNLRAYKFSNSDDFFARNPVTQSIGEQLERLARNGVFSLEGALNQLMPDSMETIDEVLSKELIDYGSETYIDLVQYLKETGIEMNDVPEYINVDTGKRNDYNQLVVESTSITQREEGTKDQKGSVLEEQTNAARKQFLEDFLYNFWFNSMFVNQAFDGDTSVGISNIINYFKRQKSGVAAGPNYRNYSIENEDDDVTTTATLQEIFGYLNEVDKETAVQALNTINKKKISWIDGQGYTTLMRRIKKFAKAGLMTDSLREALMVARIEYVDRRQQEILEAHDIVLNSDKPVIAGPYDYVKDSEHIILRGDVSTIRPDHKPIVIDLYNQLDAVDTSTPEGINEYKEIIKTIHQYFTPRPDKALLHILLNSMEYHMIDVVTDESARKKSNPTPTLVNVDSLDADLNIDHPSVTINIKDENGDIVTKEIPMIEEGYGNITTGKPSLYINLAHSKITVPNELVYDQVLTGAATEAVGDPIQPKIMLPAQLDDPKFGKEVKAALKELRQLESELATSRQEIVSRLFKGGVGTPAGLIAETIQGGLSRQGASTNLKKLYATINGKNKYNLNLPIHGKAPLYYFFSLFNHNLFGPKVAGEKYYHVSSLGYKLIFDKVTGEQIPEEKIKTNPLEYLENRDKYDYRYPSVKIEDDKIVVECLIPKKLGQTPEDTRFFERLYGDYLLGMRIPTELKRSMVVIKVVGYLDAAYSNSIVVPPQVHLWAGSDLDIDALYTQGYAYYRNSLNELVKYNDLTPYTDLGMSQDEASFLEFLHFVREDLGFADLIDLESERIKANTEYKIESIADGAALFGINIKQFFEAAEAMAGEDIDNKPQIYKDVLKDILKKKALLTEGNHKVKIGDNQATVVKMLLRLVPVINVLNQYEILGKGKALTVENFKSYVKKNGNPTSPSLHNRALKLKTDILSNPIVYDTFTRNFSADDAIDSYKKAAGVLENLSETSKIKKSNRYTPQTVGRVRGSGKGSKMMVGGNASNAKTITMLATAKAKLSDKYTFNFETQRKGKFKKVDTSKFIEKGPIEVSNSIGFATDDVKNQLAGVLNLFINNSGIMNYMYAVGYDPQFAKLIHSVDSIKKVINDFLIINDPGYITPGSIGFSFTTTVNQALMLLVNQNEEALRKQGLLTASESGKKGEYSIDKNAFTIQYSQVLSPVENRLPSSLGITILNKNGEPINDALASIVTLHFYNQMLQLSNQLSFKLGPVSDVLKKLKPNWTTVSKIRDAVKFVGDNDVFEGGNINALFKAYPVVETLAKDSLNFMTDTSKQVLLDQTYLVRGITNLFKANRELTEDQVIAELKSILGLQVLRQYVTNEASTLKADDDSGIAAMIRTFAKAFTTDYWLKNEAGEDLKFLQKKFPTNEFLRSLTTRPALYKPIASKQKVDVIISNLGNKLTIESQERLMNDFYYLLTQGDSEVRNAVVNIAVHGMIRDGAMSKQEGYLKVIAPEMFNRLSEQLDKVQDIFYALDKADKKIDDVEKYMEALNEGLSEVFKGKTTINGFMQAILNKIVSSVTYDVTGNPSIQMSFWQGSRTAPNKGAFSDIPLPVFTSIIDNILPNNKKYIYVKNDKQIKPYHGLKYTSGKTSDFRFEIWKADVKEVNGEELPGELFFDLRNVNKIEEQDALARILKKQGIYFSDGQYSFPLYKVNNYESGQIFILTELDGKPITSSFFANLFNSYKSKSESTELLKGSTAKYVVYKRQGLDRISPNGLTSETASSLYEAAKGEKSISAKRVEAKELPKGLTYVPNNETIIVKDLDLANELKDARYKVKDEEWYIRSGSLTYKITMDRRGQVYVYKRGKSSFFPIYNQTKEMSEEKELTQFLEKIGFADMASFLQSDSNVKSSIVPAPGTTNVFSVLSYNVNKKKSEGVAPNVTEPVIEELNKDNPFKDLPLKNTIEQLNEAVLDLNDINQNLVVHEPGDELTVYFNKSDNEQDLELKSFNKTQYGFRVVLSPGGAKEYTYFVDNKGVGEKIEILTEGVFEITPELTAEKNALENKAKQLFEVYQSKASQQVFIQGKFPTFAISPVLENITIQRERRRQISENPDNFETYRGEPEEITGYKIIIPGHDTQLYLTSQNMIEDLRTGRSMPALTASRSIKNFIEGVTKAATNLIKGSEKESVLAEIGFDVTKFYKPEKDLSDLSEFPEAVSVTETTIEYTPVGKQRQTYTIRGTKVFNKAGQEVFKEDSVDRNKIFANLALKQGRAVLVEHKGAKYIVNNKNQIISGTTGKIMQWDENNGDRKAIVALAQEKFPTQFIKGKLDGSKMTQEIEGKLEANKDRLIDLLGSSMYSEKLKDVIYKELLQNSFDAIKIAESKGLISKGKIDINIDESNRSITFTDNGIGMTADIVQQAFFTIGGTYKGDNIDNKLKSGGLGLAKMAFIFGSERLTLETVNNGVKTTVDATSEEIRNSNFKIKTEPTTEKNGTKVTVKVPETYINAKGETRTIDFPRYAESEFNYSFLKNPLIGNVDVTYRITNRDASFKQDEIIETTLGKVPKGYVLFSPASTGFADMDIYIDAENITKGNFIDTKHSILSSGLFQFNIEFKKDGSEQIPLNIIVDVKPKVDPTNAQYPFNNQRENFRPTIKEDIAALNQYLKLLWKSIEVELLKTSFSKIKNIEKVNTENVSKDTIAKNQEIVKEFSKKSNKEIITKAIQDFTEKNEKAEISNGNLQTKEISMSKQEITKDSEKRYSSSFKAQKEIDVNTDTDLNLDSNKPIIHNNTTMNLSEGATKFLSEISSIMIDYKNSIIKFYGEDYSRNIKDQLWGVSIDKTYGGVNVNPSFVNMLAINPFYNFPTNPNVDAVNYIAVGIDHLIIHELNHNFERNEGAGFTGRFLQTYSEIHSLPNHFELMSKLKLSIKNNLEIIKSLNYEYQQSENVESGFEGNRLQQDNERGTSERTKVLSKTDSQNNDRTNRNDKRSGDSIGEILNGLDQFKPESEVSEDDDVTDDNIFNC